MRVEQKLEVIETKSGYTLSEESAKIYTERWKQGKPTLKKIVWGVEIKKPLYFSVIEGFIGEDGIQYANTLGWVFEENGRTVDFRVKDNAKKYAK